MTKRHPLSQKFHDLLKEIGDLHDRKQADYGTDASPFANVEASADFGIQPWIGAMVRANDKMRRIQKAAKGHQLVNEGLRDSLMDLAVYSLIALVLLEKGSEQREESWPPK
jgi:hypothetical protein